MDRGQERAADLPLPPSARGPPTRHGGEGGEDHRRKWVQGKDGQNSSELHWLKYVIENNGQQVGLAHCALECKPKVDWNKGNASLLILEKEFGAEWQKR